MLMDNPNILDINFLKLNKIIKILDDKNTLDNFLEKLPSCYCSDDLLVSMTVEGQKPNMTPAKFLILNLGSRGVRKLEFIKLLENAQLLKALVLLKNDEPIQIIEQPQKYLKLEEGSKLMLSCKATSFPPPEYQWFRYDTELLLQEEPELIISPVMKQNAGIYTCRIATKSTETESYSCQFTEPTIVEITPSEKCILPVQDHSKEKSSISLGVKPKNKFSITSHLNMACNESLSDSNDENDTLIKIIRQPYHKGKVPHGNSVLLLCEAMSEYPLKYQWYCNGKKLKNETSPELHIRNLYPDQETGEAKYLYQCKIFHAYDSQLSDVVSIELDEIDESSPCFAKEKIAFLVANDDYMNLDPLIKPPYDVADLAEALSSMQFKVFALRNLTYSEMKNAFHIFCEMLESNTYALVYFAGHGYDICGQTYLEPVDCSGKCLPQESLCTQYLLQCMQEKNPALKVALIDTCREIPDKISYKKTQIFIPKNMDNTVYGYSTTLSNFAAENDEEQNGFYIKYLKKYIKHNKRIEHILSDVQLAFQKDPIIKKKQYSEFTSTLAPPRKLCDPISSQQNKPSKYDKALSWADMKSKPVCSRIFNISDMGASIILEFEHHMKVFCNALDMNVYMEIEKNASLELLNMINVDVKFEMDEKDVIEHKRHNKLQAGGKNFLFKKEIHKIHRFKDSLKGYISFGISQETNFTVPFELDNLKIFGLKLSINQLHIDAINDPNILKDAFPSDEDDNPNEFEEIHDKLKS